MSAAASPCTAAPMLDILRTPLLTDLYELTMYDAYLEAGMVGPASFEFFVRKLPPCRNFLLACGLAQVVEFVLGARFGEAELAWLEGCGRFSPRTIARLARFRFTGDVDAVPEGTVVFAHEPILRVTAPLPEAQLLETRLVNLLHFQTLIASKAARMVLAAGEGKMLLDFGLRRAHGAEAGVLAARASYIAGFAGSATVPAEPLFGIPVYGTMAHSFVQAHEDEIQAFLHFARARPQSLVLLIDTYDTERAAQRVVELAPKLAAEGIPLRGVRIDSGDLAEHARKVRRILDEGGLREVRIFASGGIDEQLIARHVAEGVPIDGWGVGTSLTTSNDWASLDCAYKLVDYAGKPRRKRSEGKATLPARKQVFRRFDRSGRMVADTIALESERLAGEPLLVPVIRGGELVSPLPSLARIRERVQAQYRSLPEPLKGLEPAHDYPVDISQGLSRLVQSLDQAGDP
ncbi:Nicotinate phosphoribosyltransferase pncB2 [bacterium HR40]|nr:Nicotinate phosphoribosyltransferase pncB2 [bacterium HR40]